LPAHEAGALNIAVTGSPRTARGSPGESLAVHGGHRIGEAGVAVGFINIDVVDDTDVVSAAAIEAASIPTVIRLARTERNPSDMVEAAAETDERQANLKEAGGELGFVGERKARDGIDAIG